jgi:hypothetical protein
MSHHPLTYTSLSSSLFYLTKKKNDEIFSFYTVKMAEEKKSKLPASVYFDSSKIPEEWFMPFSEFSQSEHVKNYMDPEGRAKTLKVMLDSIISQKKKERTKK